MKPFTLFQLFFRPTQGWESVLKSQPSIPRLYMLHVIPFSLIPPLMIYLSSKNHGDALFDLIQIVSGPKLVVVAIALFLVQIIVVPAMASIIRQLSEVAEIQPSYKEAFILAAIAPTPLWLAPIFLFIPDISVNLIVTTLALMASAGFIYYGIPVVFKLEEEGHALLLFGAILMAGVIAWGILMICTLMLWGSVQNLQFVGTLAS
jgi:hypothetical protein